MLHAGLDVDHLHRSAWDDGTRLIEHGSNQVAANNLSADLAGNGKSKHQGHEAD